MDEVEFDIFEADPEVGGRFFYHCWATPRKNGVFRIVSVDREVGKFRAVRIGREELDARTRA